MKAFRIFFTILAILFAGTHPAMANQPPGPQVMLAEIFILPMMALLSLLGGAYVIMNRMEKKKNKLIKIIVVFLAIFVSGAHEGFGVLVALVFGIYAMTRAVKMVSWGIDARSIHNTGSHLDGANSWRLITSGVSLILITLFLTGMAVAFVGYWPTIGQVSREKGFKKFVTYHIAYARLEAEKTSDTARRSIPPEIKQILGLNPPNSKVRVEYRQDSKQFTAYMLPTERMPFFPFNYLTSQPSYRADETGEIRMIRVHRKDHVCPEDAPVVMRVERKDIGEAYNNLISYLKITR